jgi:hypothetical protein
MLPLYLPDLFAQIIMPLIYQRPLQEEHGVERELPMLLLEPSIQILPVKVHILLHMKSL